MGENGKRSVREEEDPKRGARFNSSVLEWDKEQMLDPLETVCIPRCSVSSFIQAVTSCRPPPPTEAVLVELLKVVGECFFLVCRSMKGASSTKLQVLFQGQPREVIP